MANSQQRGDCLLDLNEAWEGDLPPVCIWCGEATDALYPVPFNYRWQRLLLQLPLCGSHKNHYRWRIWARKCFNVGVGLFFLGMLGGGLTTKQGKSGTRVATPMFVAFTCICLFGILVVFGSLAARILLALSGIRISRLGPGVVTLKNVASEFIEAYRVYRWKKLKQATFPWLVDTTRAGKDLVAHDSVFAEEAQQVLQVAAHEAAESGQGYLGTKHLLVALRVAITPAARVLQGLGLEPEQVREAQPTADSAGGEPTAPANLPPTPALRRVLERAAAEAQALNHPSVRAGHLLLALLRDPENEAVQFLLDLGIAPEEASRRVAEAVRSLEGIMAKQDGVTR
jgi:Clp amino terminal domain, pathogenicity island component